MKLAIWALAAALLVPSLAAANPDQRGDRRAERRAKILERFDANRDGQLDPREKRQAKTAMRVQRMERRAKRLQRLIERFDRNRDGNLGPGEVPPKAMHKLKRLDRDGDGWVRPNEMRMKPQQRRHGRPMEEPAAPHDDASQAPGAGAPGAYDDGDQY
jgi:hypothetical protein